MKVDRLIGIITILQRHKKVTAAFLADKFEVSTRTINRDINAICQAGIPIVTEQGKNGGISIMPGFVLDTTVFTEEELGSILTGVKTLDSVSKHSLSKSLIGKLGNTDSIELPETMMIDLSSFYKDDLASKIELIRSAIRENKCISFRYCYKKGEADKLIEPHLLVFKWSSWYVFGYCNLRKAFRMYKLRRLWDLKVTNDEFCKRSYEAEVQNFGNNMTDKYIITAIYDFSVKYRLVEEYGPNSFSEMEDGSLYAEWGFTNQEEAVNWFLSFGSNVKIISPADMVEKMKKVLLDMQENYKT